MLLLLVAALLLAGGDVSANACGGRLTPVQLLCVQSGLWTLLLLPWAVRHPREARGVKRGWLFLQAAANLAFFYANVLALGLLPVTWATSILSAATPFCVLILVFALFGVRPPLAEVGWMGLVAVGVFLVTHDPTVPGPHLPGGQALGLAAACAASGLLAFTFVAIGRVADSDSVNTINLWYAVLTFAVCLPLALRTPWPAFSWPPVLYGLLGYAGQVAIVQANVRIGPAAAGTVAALVPGMAAVIAWALYHQPPDPLEALGIATVVGGCVVIARIEGGREQPFATPFRWER